MVTGYKLRNTVFRVRVSDLGFTICGAGIRDKGSKDYGLGFREYGLGIVVKGLGFSV